MDEKKLPVGKTRSTHSSIAYHLVWIPKYRRRVLTGEVQVETKRLITKCCQKHGLTIVQRIGEAIWERYTGPLNENTRQMVTAQAAKRVVIFVKPVEVVSWDHRKLGGGY